MSGEKRTELIIEANKSKLNYWKDLWNYRELFYFLAWKDILIRYKQTVIGVAWSFIRPLFTMIILTIVFGRIAKLPSNNAPYPIMVFSAMLPWQFFSNAFNEASNSLISNANLLTKVYFPRLIIPTTTIIVSLIDFFISIGIMIILMFVFHFTPSWQILFLPFFLLLVIVISLGAGYFIASLNVQYRDFRYIVPFIVQFGLYISPVGFSSDTIPDKWRLIYSINPMVGVIDGFRWCILGVESKLYLNGLIISISIAIFLLVIGIKTFRKMEKIFADVV